MSVLRAVPAKARRIFLLDSSSGIFHGIYMGGIIPFLGVIARGELGASPLLIAVISAAPFAGYLASPYFARRLERGGKKVALVVLSSLGGRAAFVLLALVHSSVGLTAVAGAAMLIPAFCMPAYTALLKDIYPDEWRGRLTSLSRVGVNFAALAASAVVGVLLARWSFRVVLPLVALFTMIGPIVLFSRIPEPKPTATPPELQARGSLSVLSEDPLYVKYLLAFFLASFGGLMYAPLIPILQVDQLHITTDWVGMLGTVSALFAGLSFYLWGKMIDARGAVACALVFALGWAAAAIGYAAVPSLPWLIPLAVVTGLAGSARELAMVNAVMQFADQERIPRYSSVLYTSVGISGLAAPLCGALLATVLPVRTVFWLCGGVVLLGFLLMLQVMKEKQWEEQRRNEVPAYE